MGCSSKRVSLLPPILLLFFLLEGVSLAQELTRDQLLAAEAKIDKLKSVISQSEIFQRQKLHKLRQGPASLGGQVFKGKDGRVLYETQSVAKMLQGSDANLQLLEVVEGAGVETNFARSFVNSIARNLWGTGYALVKVNSPAGLYVITIDEDPYAKAFQEQVTVLAGQDFIKMMLKILEARFQSILEEFRRNPVGNPGLQMEQVFSEFVAGIKIQSLNPMESSSIIVPNLTESSDWIHQVQKQLQFFESFPLDVALAENYLLKDVLYEFDSVGLSVLCQFVGNKDLAKQAVEAELERIRHPDQPWVGEVTYDRISLQATWVYPGRVFYKEQTPFENSFYLYRICVIRFPDHSKKLTEIRARAAQSFALIDKIRVQQNILDQMRRLRKADEELKSLENQIENDLQLLNILLDGDFQERESFITSLTQSFEGNVSVRETVALELLQMEELERHFFIPEYRYADFLSKMDLIHHAIIESRMDDAFVWVRAQSWNKDLHLEFRILEKEHLCRHYFAFALPRFVGFILDRLESGVSMETLEGITSSDVQSGLDRFLIKVMPAVERECPYPRNLHELKRRLKLVKEKIAQAKLEEVSTDEVVKRENINTDLGLMDIRSPHGKEMKVKLAAESKGRGWKLYPGMIDFVRFTNSARAVIELSRMEVKIEASDEKWFGYRAFDRCELKIDSSMEKWFLLHDAEYDGSRLLDDVDIWKQDGTVRYESDDDLPNNRGVQRYWRGKEGHAGLYSYHFQFGGNSTPYVGPKVMMKTVEHPSLPGHPQYFADVIILRQRGVRNDMAMDYLGCRALAGRVAQYAKNESLLWEFEWSHCHQLRSLYMKSCIDQKSGEPLFDDLQLLECPSWFGQK